MIFNIAYDQGGSPYLSSHSNMSRIRVHEGDACEPFQDFGHIKQHPKCIDSDISANPNNTTLWELIREIVPR